MAGTTLSVVTNFSGSETRVSTGSFNGSLGATYALGLNITNYEIFYGNASLSFAIGQVPLHKVTTTTAAWTDGMHFVVFADVVNTGNSSAVAMYVRAMSIARIGILETNPHYYRVTTAVTGTVLKWGPGRLHHIVINDSKSGTTLSIFDSNFNGGPVIAVLANFSTTAAGSTMSYGLPFNNGLTITSTGTWDITVVYE